MYNAGYYMGHHEFNWKRLHEIRERESINYRDEKARAMMENLKKERAEKNTGPPT